MKYKYHKGSEADFDGAPEWATMKTKECGITYFVEGHFSGARFMSQNGRLGKIENGDDDYSGVTVIAHREPINANGGHERIKCGELIMDGKEHCATLCGGDETEALIAERGSRYGKFKDGADIMQSLKDTMRDVDGWNNLTASQKEALDMIQHKIGRILNGDPTYDDSWKDIAGYATLIVNELSGEIK